MKRSIVYLAFLAAVFALPACSNKKKDDSKTENKETNGKTSITSGTPAAVAAEWCALNERVTFASEADKEKAKAKLKEFENDMETRYKDDQAFLEEVEKEVEKCEDASEGR